MKKTHIWPTSSGKKVTAICELKLNETVGVDGYSINKKCCKKHFRVTVEGMGVVGYSIDRTPRNVGGVCYAATCGKLAISNDNLLAIDLMIAEVEAHPAWIEKKAAEKRADKAASEYELHCQKITAAMGE